MEDDRTLEALVLQSAQGDEVALRALTSAVTRPLFPYLMSRTKSRDEAKDVLQDTLVDVWQSLARFSYRSDAEFFAFVFTIAKRKLGRIHMMQAKEEPLGDWHDVADGDALSQAQTSLAVSGALTKLSGKDKEIVTLRYWSGLSFLSIGRILSMSEGAVRVRHHRALHELEETLTPYVA